MKSKICHWYRAHSGFLEPEKYERLIAANILVARPKFYNVLRSGYITTVDGLMVAMELGEDISDPDFAPIAEFVVNGHSYFWWNDAVWGVAVAKNGVPVARFLDSGQTIIVLYRLNQLEDCDDDGNG